ncbi:DNA gyrase subunit A [Candidatus Woesearchaeota archaeon]|nr:DNA gyrase subunit A [Candidatus Woesearchaeota archaeon]
MPEEIQPRLIEEELKNSYLNYSMSVIVGRALPDVRDGLKPVHRRILYAMHELGMHYNRPYKKCARIVGEVLGKYHPHGDSAVYDALVRMAQPFSLRHPLIDGQGNFGSIDGDNAAAMRYTEARLSQIAGEILFDIEKETVDFTPNFDNSLKEPVVLPSRIPNLLVNGSSGIAVGMATNIPPHNLREVCRALTHFIDNPECSVSDIIPFIQGPDFPTGGNICGRQGIREAYETGHGRIIVRGKAEVKGKKIVITEIPYQVNKTTLIEAIAALVREKRIEGISDIRDESDRRGMSIVIELKTNASADVVLNQLYKHTNLQTTFGVQLLALVDSQPKVLSILDIFSHYISFRKGVILRSITFDLVKAERRLHILAGLRVALQDVDGVVSLIRSSKDVETARIGLVSRYKLSELQANSILDMRLQRFTSLEQEKIYKEIEELRVTISELQLILSNESKVFAIIKNELSNLAEQYGDERRTTIISATEDFETEDLLEKQDVVITVTHSGYIKQTPLELYRQQRRGGRGTRATLTKEEDLVEHLFVTSNLNHLLFFSNLGRVYWLHAYQVPEGSRYAKGKALVNLLSLQEREYVAAVLPIQTFDDQHYLLFATKQGLLKKTNLYLYSRPRKTGIVAIGLRDGDEVVQVRLTPGTLRMVLATKYGFALRFDESAISPVGRGAAGVRGVRLRSGDCVIGMEVDVPGASLLSVTKNGFGKRSNLEDYRLISRGGRGVVNIKTKYLYPDNRNDAVTSIKTVRDGDEVLLISHKGVIIRLPVGGIPLVGRGAQGVRLMRLDEDDALVSMARIIVVHDNGN